jgi:hypothetical protein
MSNVEGKLSYVEEFMNFLTEQSQPWVSMPLWTLHSQALASIGLGLVAQCLRQLKRAMGEVLSPSTLRAERTTWSRLPYRPCDIHCLPTVCRTHADTRKEFPRTSPKRLCRELWSEGHLPQHRKAM